MSPNMFDGLDWIFKVLMVFATIGAIVSVPIILWLLYHLILAIVQYLK